MKVKVFYTINTKDKSISFEEIVEVRTKFLEQEVNLILRDKWDEMLDSCEIEVNTIEECINKYTEEDIKYMYAIGLNVGQISSITGLEIEDIYYLQ